MATTARNFVILSEQRKFVTLTEQRTFVILSEASRSDAESKAEKRYPTSSPIIRNLLASGP